MIGLISLAISLALLYFVLRYRVHVYVVTVPRGPRPMPAMRQPDARRALLVDALVGLGAKRKLAGAAADKALAENPQGTVEELIGAAIRATQEAA